MFNIPENKLPDCLRDEQRINVLFAPLRSRGVNSKDWDSKIASWKIIIKSYCDTNDIYAFSVSQLNDVFVRNGRPPSCLNEVLNDMIRNGELQQIDDFWKNLSTWGEWATALLSWPYNKVRDKLFTFKSLNHTFVHLGIIESKCENLVNLIPRKYKNKLISLKDVLQLWNKDLSQVNNLKLLLHNLYKQHRIDVTTLNGTNKEEFDCFLIKFSDGSKVFPITEVDIGTYMLEETEKNLIEDVRLLEDDLQLCLKEAKSHLKENHRQLVSLLLYINT